MKENFRGWRTVFGFTFRQSTKNAGFKVITALIAFLIIGIIILATVIQAKPDNKSKAEISPIKTVFVLDQSGLLPTDFKSMNPKLAKKQYKHINYIKADGQTRDEVIKQAGKASDKSIAVIISAKDTGYELEAIIPDKSTITRNQADKLIKCMATGFESSKLMQSGLSAEQLTAVLAPAVTSYSNIGENTNETVIIIKIVAPMVFSLMLYMMLMIYGQTVSKSVSDEKTSKLMETLLTSIHPYALIAGKVLAVTSMALIQFVIWIASGFIGLYAGNAAAHAIYPDYQNTVVTVINFLKDNIGQTALSAPAVILAIIFFIISFLFYCVIAGIAGCMVSKPEDAASTLSVFMFPIMISWLIVYLAPITKNYTLLAVARYIPFTSPFCVPSDLITGTIGIGEGMITLAVLAAFSFLLIMLSGRIYKGLILYNGEKVSFKKVINILSNKN